MLVIYLVHLLNEQARLKWREFFSTAKRHKAASRLREPIKPRIEQETKRQAVTEGPAREFTLFVASKKCFAIEAKYVVGWP